MFNVKTFIFQPPNIKCHSSISRGCSQTAVIKWATSWQKQNGMCAQRRLRSAWASAQSDQSLRCALNGQLRTPAFLMRTAKTLIRLGGCPGWSESSLGAHALLLVLSWGGSNTGDDLTRLALKHTYGRITCITRHLKFNDIPKQSKSVNKEMRTPSLS